MSFQTNAKTKTPAELSEQQRGNWRSEMGVAYKNGSKSNDFNVNNILMGGDTVNPDGNKVQVAKKPDIGVIVGLDDDNVSVLLRSSRNKKTQVGFSEASFYDKWNVGSAGGERNLVACIGSDTLNVANAKMNLSPSGNMTIAGTYSPFTGTHIATSNDNLKVGELVSLSSDRLDGRQPIWMASYCVGAKKGVFGVVYDIEYQKELYEVEEEVKIIDKGVERTEKASITKERDTDVVEYYFIAAVGDAVVNFSNENGECEPGDYLIPSSTKKGCVMVSKENFIPLNHCGKAGESCSENRLIAWVKE